MTPKEFNNLTEIIFKDRLSQFGFKKHKGIFYLHKSPNIIAIVKHYYRHDFLGFFICGTHDFLANTTDDSKKLALPAFLEDYPFSISIDELVKQYQKHPSVQDFDYDTNFLTRSVLPTRTSTGASSLWSKVIRDEHLTRATLHTEADHIIEFGQRLMNEYSPIVSYQSMTRHKKVNDFTLDKFKSEIEKYCFENNIQLPKRKHGWFSLFKKKGGSHSSYRRALYHGQVPQIGLCYHILIRNCLSITEYSIRSLTG